MLPVQRLSIEKIYCSSLQDRNFTFSLVRINNEKYPVRRVVSVYNNNITLPNNNNAFHMFVIGNLSPKFLNLLEEKHQWYRDVWTKASDDMVTRNILITVYNEHGNIFPREFTYYSFIDENSILVALEIPVYAVNKFDFKSYKYINFYTNYYYNTVEFNSLPSPVGIDYKAGIVRNNVDKVAFQTFITNKELNGGKSMVFVDGFYTDNVNLNIPDDSYVEVVYDQSIISKEEYVINDLKTFTSSLDDKVKYLLHRAKAIDFIQYKDDNTLFIKNNGNYVNKGLYLYTHLAYMHRNVTDKDYSLSTLETNNMANYLSTITTGSLQDKSVVLYTRKTSSPPVSYSSCKFNELYKLDLEVESNVLLNNGYNITELRAEALEDSYYFKLASTKANLITPTLATQALGYNGVTYYLCNTPNLSVNNTVNVPVGYRNNFVAMEYNTTGLLTGYHGSTGDVYPCQEQNTKTVNFIYGHIPPNSGKLYKDNETATLRHKEYVVSMAVFDNVISNKRITDWEDITNSNLYTVTGNSIQFNLEPSYRAKISYLDEVNIYNKDVTMTDGLLYFPIEIKEDRGNGLQVYPAELPYSNVDIYLNGYRLIYGLDFFVNFPYVNICSKMYYNYNDPIQKVTICCYGIEIDKNKINKREIKGFVNQGVLLRNHKYDVLDDRVYSCFVAGKLYDKSNIITAENDTTIRLADPLNGKAYVITEPFISIYDVTTEQTLPYIYKNDDVNNKISDLYDIVKPEPVIDEFMVISNHHYLFSPIVSLIIHDMKSGAIPATMYTNPYDDMTLLTLLGDVRYKKILDLDPIKYLDETSLQNIVKIDPVIEPNGSIELNLFQYRFVDRIIKMITNNKPENILLSGYIVLNKLA